MEGGQSEGRAKSKREMTVEKENGKVEREGE